MILFCFAVSLLSILIMAAISLLLQKRSLRAEFIQAGYRGSQALLGAALLQNIYGDTGPLALVLIGRRPPLQRGRRGGPHPCSPQRAGDWTGKQWARPCGASLPIPSSWESSQGSSGLCWASRSPVILQRTVSSFAATATPLGLVALGACIDLKKAAGCLRLTLVCSAFKLILFAAVFLPIAVLMGCRGELLVGMLIMLASPHHRELLQHGPQHGT